MKRIRFIIFGAALLGVLVALGTQRSRTNGEAHRDHDTPGATIPSGPLTQSDATQRAAMNKPPASNATDQISPEERFDRWIADTTSPDARTRAAAIAALAEAPKAKAVPALEQVLDVGEPEIDRQIALRSLHTLALRQGDDDGRIRDVMRGVVYHGDDEGSSASAQAFLEDIEAEFAEKQEP